MDREPNDDRATVVAKRWLALRRRHAFRPLWAGLCVTPLVGGMISGGMEPWLPWLGYSALLLIPFVAVAVMIGAEERARTARVRSALDHGQRRRGSVQHVRTLLVGGDVLKRTRVEIAVLLDSGDTLDAGFEQLEHRVLPVVEEGAMAIAWTHDGRTVVGACGVLFESAD